MEVGAAALAESVLHAGSLVIEKAWRTFPQRWGLIDANQVRSTSRFVGAIRTAIGLQSVAFAHAITIHRLDLSS
jgi:hypothetical protein